MPLPLKIFMFEKELLRPPLDYFWKKFHIHSYNVEAYNLEGYLT